jgi:hypothetical protein
MESWIEGIGKHPVENFEAEIIVVLPAMWRPNQAV